MASKENIILQNNEDNDREHSDNAMNQFDNYGDGEWQGCKRDGFGTEPYSLRIRIQFRFQDPDLVETGYMVPNPFLVNISGSDFVSGSGSDSSSVFCSDFDFSSKSLFS